MSDSTKTNTAVMDKEKTVSKSDVLELFRQMYLIRQFEIACSQHYTLGNIRGFLHLFIGQEASGVGSIAALGSEDYIVSHYREHGHALARGLNVNRVMAELFGKRTGLSKGKGGSMHLFDISKRFMGGHAIVGAQIPLAAGMALSQQYFKRKGLTMCYFGDGSTSQGVFHETLNMSALWNLPIIFFLENNGYGMGTSLDRARSVGDDLSKGITETYGIETVVVDGMDVLAVLETTRAAVAKVRSSSKPIFIESKTYRFEGHSLADGQKYRDEGDIDPWRKLDPILTFPERMIADYGVEKDEIEAVKVTVDEVVEESVKFATTSEEPTSKELWDDIYA